MIFPKIVCMNDKPKQVKQVKQVRTINPANVKGKLIFKSPTGCGCGKKAT